jgi:hypothetical protein
MVLPPFWSVAALGPTNVWIGATAALYHYDGVSLTKVNDGSNGPAFTGYVRGLRVFASNDVWFASGADMPLAALHWTGSSYTAVPFTGDFPNGPTYPLIVGPAPNDLWYLADASLVHWNGSAWTHDDRPAGGLNGVASAGGTTYVVGNYGAILRKAQ